MIETIYCWRLVCVFVIAILGSASAQTFNVSIIVSPPMTGQVNEGQVLSYTLNCSAASSSGPPPNVTWVSYPSGAVLNNTSSRILVLPSPVQLSYAGLYVCNASANGVSRTASYAFNVSVRTLLLIPAITVTNIPSTLNYQGSLLVLVCSYGIQGIQAVNLTGYSIQWAGPTPQSVEADGQRVSIATSNSSAGGGGGIIYTSNLIISSLSKKDGGTYTCTPSVGPKAFSPYVIPYTEPKTSQPVTVLDLPLSVTVSPANLLSSSNSTFQINCTATKPSSVPLPFVFVWSWKDTYNGGSVLTFNSSGTFTSGGTTFVTTQPPGVTNSTPNVTSTLTVSLPLPGTHSCQCDVVINVPIDGPTNRTASATVSVPGRPNQPTNVTAKSISMDTISVQWQIPYIVYTQERYVVQYGSAPSNLSQSSTVVNGSAYLNTSGGQFSVNLTGLIPNSLYYYTIVASNTEGTTTTPVMNISFFPPDGVMSLTIGSGDQSHFYVSWAPPSSPNNDVMYYLVVVTPFSGGANSSVIVSGLSANLTGTYKPGVPYNASVTGYNVLGYGKTITTYGYIMELAPNSYVNMKVTSVNGSTILVSWEPLSPVEARGFVRYYLVTWSPTTSKARGSTGTVNLTADITMYLITGLDPMVSYTISVSAGTGGGQGTLKAEIETGVQTPGQPQSCGVLCVALPIIITLLVFIVVVVVCAISLLFICVRRKRGDPEVTPSPHHYEDILLDTKVTRTVKHSSCSCQRVVLTLSDHLEKKIGVYVDVEIASAKLKKDREYIMIQGSYCPEVRDFWKFVWQEKINTVVMVTQCKEGEKRKCEQYWPSNKGDTIEPCVGLKVTLEEVTPYGDFVTRKIKVELAGSDASQMVYHFQYQGWPEVGVPSSTTSITDFARHVHKGRGPPGPLLVACSCHSNSNGPEAIIALVCVAGVMERMGDMCDCPPHDDLYSSFVHMAIDELSCQTAIAEADLHANISELHQFTHGKYGTGFDQQFQKMGHFTNSLKLDQSQNDKSKTHSYQNQPIQNSRHCVKHYSNASFIDGYKVHNAYIAAQAPLQNTVEDFWRMVWEFKCRVIVMLCSLSEEGVMQFWPSEGQTIPYGGMSITSDKAESFGKCSVYMSEIKSDQGNSHKVTLIHYTDWSKDDDRPQSSDDIISILSLPDLQVTATNPPIIVVGSDGMGRTGTFITIHAMMERLKTEHVVDFFQFIKSSRIRRPNFVRSLEQYIFCYDCIENCIQFNDK